MEPKLCKGCGKYQAMSWGKGYCLRCWMKPEHDDIPVPEDDDQVIDNSETGPDEVTEESHCYTCGEYLSDCICS